MYRFSVSGFLSVLSISRILLIGISAILGLTAAAGALSLRIEVRAADSSAPIADVNVILQDSSATAITDENGVAVFDLSPGQYRILVSHVGYQPVEKILRLDRDTHDFQIELVPRVWEVAETVQAGRSMESQAGEIELAVTEMRRYPSPTPDPLRFVKVLPGVASGNDFSGAYHAQGGNYAENLLYINGVEVELPQQIRCGLAETFSPINPVMLEKVRFQAGAFPVGYGDKLTSLLDVEYRRPEERFGGYAEASLLQQNAVAGGRAGRLRWLAGFRRADLSRLTKGLQTTGDFRPRFSDGQAQLEWEASPETRVTAYGLAMDSDFTLQPNELVLRYDCGLAPPGGQACDEFRGAGEGAERFDYRIRLLGMRWRHARPGHEVEVFVNLLDQEEREDTDLTYTLRWLPKDKREGWGRSMRRQERFASRFDMRRMDMGTRVRLGRREKQWDLGAGLRQSRLQAAAEGFEEVEFEDGRYLLEDQQQVLDSRPADPYFFAQRTWRGKSGEGVGGMRLVRFGATGEVLMLPRFSARRQLREGVELQLAGGRYAQPPLYRELLGAEGELVAQKADQASLGLAIQADSLLSWKTEVYYRRLRDLISYALDDLRLVYAGANDARGYAWGVNTHVRGELERLVGILSYGYLMSREDLRGDGRGDLPRPTDQRHTLSGYLEDRMELRPFRYLLASRFHIRMLYGSGFPYTPMLRPDDMGAGGLEQGPRHSRRYPGYFRFDMGMTQMVRVWGWKMEIREEVANLFDQFNVVGYTYLPGGPDTLVELRNALGRRTVNLSLATRFERAE